MMTAEQFRAYLQISEPTLTLVSSTAEPQDDYVLERLMLELPGGVQVRALLTRPEAPGRYPAILYAHSHGDRYDVGAAELIEGREYLLSPWGPLLARNGYVALSLDMPTFGSQSGQTESSLTKALIWYGKSLIGRMIEQQMAALSYLASRPDVDPERIGGFGISLGSTLSYWQAAIDPRLKAIAHLCCFADYATLVELGAHDHHGVYLLVPGMLNHIATGEIAGLVAPRPQLICVGQKDELTPPLAVLRALHQTKTMYAAAGAAEALEFYRAPDARHEETLEMRERVLALFARAL